MANIILTAKSGLHRSTDLVIPTSEVLSTTLYITDGMRHVPTLVSVESVVGRLAGLGLVVKGEQDLDALAHAINTRLLTVPVAEWRDVKLSIHSEQLRPGDQPILGAVHAVRQPTLAAAGRIMVAESRGDQVQRRGDEDVFVREVSSAVQKSGDLWRSHWKTAMGIVGRTVLTTLTNSLIAVPLADVIHQALGGVSRRV